MTTPEQMDVEERLRDMEVRLQVLEQLMAKRDQIIAQAVMTSLKDTVVMEVVQRVTASMEAEWSGKFLPELRATLQAAGLEIKTSSNGGT